MLNSFIFALVATASAVATGILLFGLAEILRSIYASRREEMGEEDDEWGDEE